MSQQHYSQDEGPVYLPTYFHDLTLLSQIGQGRESRVYLVQNPAGKKAALKVTKCVTPHRTNSAIREYAFLQRLSQSQRILSGYDFRLEVSPSGTITAWLLEECARVLSVDDPSLSALDRLAVGISVCEALIDCRARGIAHLDVKQSNVFRGTDGSWKLGDFSHSARLSHLGRLRAPVGSPGYMAPEVYSAHRHSQQSDIYSVGILLYRLFTGAMPFPCSADRPCPGEGAVLPEAGLSEPLMRIIRRAAARRPEDRYASFEDLRGDLNSLRTRDLPSSGALRAFTRAVPEVSHPSRDSRSLPVTMGHTFSFVNPPDSPYWFAEDTWSTDGGAIE